MLAVLIFLAAVQFNAPFDASVSCGLFRNGQDILNYIFAFLPMKDHFVVRRVCRVLNKQSGFALKLDLDCCRRLLRGRNLFVVSPSVRHIQPKALAVDSKLLSHIPTSITQRIVDLSIYDVVPNCLAHAVASRRFRARQLKTLRLLFGTITECDLRTAAVKCKNLQRLSLAYTSVPNTEECIDLLDRLPIRSSCANRRLIRVPRADGTFVVVPQQFVNVLA